MEFADALSQSLALPCGAVVKNRFFKSAMSEGLSTVDHRPTSLLHRLYEEWAEGGSGIVVTGNVMIDAKAIGEPRNVVLEHEQNLDLFRAWAAAGTKNGTHLWMQLNHPGKQAFQALVQETVAPSALPMSGSMAKFFGTPRALTEPEIQDLIERFGNAAAIAKRAGFTGVQIHAAHGYLVSQFLSPLHNQRGDKWGGSLENRMRFLLEIYYNIRYKTGKDFPIGVKLNSADFQRGGFTEEESMQVVLALADAGIDLIEISGGTYESPSMTGKNVRESTRQREAYFLTYAEQVRQLVDVPLVVTGGFRSAAGMGRAVQKGATDMVGLARPLAVEPDLPNKILAGDEESRELPPVLTGVKALDDAAMLELIWYEQQLARIGKGKQPDPKRGAWASLLQTIAEQGFNVFQKRRGK
ncbi:NADH:flavin oxidoreductase/NADH oxidase family protein [Ectobacillus ponti]|uniref:NADH:flavin oxidoreductase/NADH oxidase family protein n=1 Tax=Ectobacillus ponti TaxID=2961894 RepID=A0AA42BNI3_9BACI|nr:NADH:flavin oxidoreductase/NADH oxidase family protein [Ectobacillus ponti]MCP8968020.1 NADH:flavin oxidoreductase/NADH oxidase family protein [Ectobacillus ponti]